MRNTDKHIECISDFCGNHKTNGFWADIFQREDGSKYIGLGGDWVQFNKNTPEFIEENSKHYLPFIKACNDCEDSGYVIKNF